MSLLPEDSRLVAYLRASQRILVFTGAGISTESGIPDFRGPGGVWERRRPVYFEEFLQSEEARIEHWDYKLESWEQFRDARPNAVHDAIVQLEKSGRLHTLVTQNIDGLHQKAGNTAPKLVEIHGTNAEIECLSCGRRFAPAPFFTDYQRTRVPPRCSCPESGLLKPATISFGQNLRMDDISRAEVAAAECDLVLALGSTLSVYPAASIPLIAAQRGVPYIVINRGPTDHDTFAEVTLRLEGNVSEFLPPALEAALRG